MIDHEPPRAVRVLLVLPPMPREIVTRLLECEPDIAVVDAVGDLSTLDAATARKADVLLVSGDGSAAAAAFERMGVPPAVLAIDAHGTNVELHELKPRARALGDLSPPEFVEAIRTVTTREEVQIGRASCRERV